MTVIENLIYRLVAAFGPKLITQIIVWITEDDDGVNIDARLENFKKAYREAFDGTGVTPEQKAKLKKSVSDFINSDPNSGGL